MTDALAGQLAELLAAALVPVFAWALALLRRWHINTTVVRAVVRGAGAAYMSLVQDRDGATTGAIERAVDAGAAYVEQRIPATLGKAGFHNTDSVRQAVRAQLGTLLAADPGVKIGGPS
jgi:hypothetical protein